MGIYPNIGVTSPSIGEICLLVGANYHRYLQVFADSSGEFPYLQGQFALV